MGKELSPEEVRVSALESMGASLGELYDILRNQVSWVHFKWKQYRGLFGTNQERIDFLNVAAPAFFAELQQLLWDDILLHICRLTDPPKSAGKANLTIACFQALISDADLALRVDGLSNQVKEKTGFAREWCNRRLAHREFPVASQADARSLTPGSREDIEVALGTIRDVMNCIEVHYMKSSVLYDHGIEALDGFDALLRCLESGVEEKRRRLNKNSEEPGVASV